MGQEVVDVEHVVCVVGKLTIADPAGVGIVRADVIWVGFNNISPAIRSNHCAIRIVTSSE